MPSSPQTEVVPATETDLEIVLNLVPYYIYEMSGPMGWPCKTNGTFGGCDDMAEYWKTHNPLTDPADRWPHKEWKGYPFLVRVDGQLAGFAMIRWRPEVDTYDVGEFFILRRYQKQGVGRLVAHHLFERFRGQWEVWEMKRNTSAQAFWKKVISEFTERQFEESEERHWIAPEDCFVQRFKSIQPA